MEKIIEHLLKMKDDKYKEFTSKLIPTVLIDRIIGVRTPILKKYADKIVNTEESNVFLKEIPHFYYEENNLHAFLIMKIKRFDKCIEEINAFLPFVDNWATCDSLRPTCFAKNKKELIFHVEKWLYSDKVYTKRFGIEMLMIHYLDDDFDIKYAKAVSEIKSDEYYVNMMISWYFATALAKQYEKIVPFLENRRLSPVVHNKTIQKANESFRISTEKKTYLKKLK